MLDRKTCALLVCGFALSLAGCGGDNSKEIEIVDPLASVPVQNVDPKAPMANITPENEASHPDVLKGSIVK